MAEDEGRAYWERRRDADKQAEWRADIDRWRKAISAKVEAIHADQQERRRRREIVAGFFVVSGNVFKWVASAAAVLFLAWQAWVALVQSAGNG